MSSRDPNDGKKTNLRLRDSESSDENDEVVYIRSPKRIDKKEFGLKVDEIRYFVRNMLMMADKMREIKDPAHQYIDYEGITFKDENGKIVELGVKRFDERDYRALALLLDQQILELKTDFKNKNARNSFKIDHFFTEENRFDNWYKYLSATNKVVEGSPAMIAWLKAESFGSVDPPYIDENGEIPNANRDDARRKTSSNQLKNSLSPQLKNQGVGIRSIFSLLFFHAIRVAIVKDKASGGSGYVNYEDKRQNYFTPAMLAAFVDAGAPATFHSYNGLEKTVDVPADETSTVQHLLDTKYAAGNNVIQYSNAKKEPYGSERLTSRFVHMTAVQTILNLNIRKYDNADENTYATALNDYRLSRDVRDNWRQAFAEEAKKKSRTRRSESNTSP